MGLPEDLVIASTGEAWEPLLPDETAQAVLSSPPPTDCPPYDLVCPASLTVGLPTQVCGEFVRHGHRVVPIASDGAGSVDAALAAARAARDIAVAVTFGPTTDWATAALRARDRWGWKMALACPDPTPSAGPASATRAPERRVLHEADVVVGPEAALAQWGETFGGRRVAWDLDGPPAAPFESLDRAVRAAFPRISVVIVTFDNLIFSKLCLGSLLANTAYPNYEVIVVDNGSSDGTLPYLRDLTARHPQVRVLAQGSNRGFGPATNLGLAAATGEAFVLLNNDTVVPRGWLARLARHLADPTVGLVGPVTNRTCNEAQIAASYRTVGEFDRFARERARAFAGERSEPRMLAMFCAALRRDVYAEIGPLDERYAVGLFEDEDYALRLRAAGYRVVCAHDVFVHHAYHASIGKLVPTGAYTALFRANQRRFEEKWGISWEPHRHLL